MSARASGPDQNTLASPAERGGVAWLIGRLRRFVLFGESVLQPYKNATDMGSLHQGLTDYFGRPRREASQIRWGHAVNSVDRLQSELNNAPIMLEADVWNDSEGRFRFSNVIQTSHGPRCSRCSKRFPFVRLARASECRPLEGTQNWCQNRLERPHSWSRFLTYS